MDKRLRVQAGPDKGLVFVLPETGIHNIGKIRQHNEICLHDMKLSRVHCQVEVDDDRAVLTDLDSEVGTYVNGERVTQHQLRHGDLVRLGDTEMVFEDIQGAGADTHVAGAAATQGQATAASTKPSPTPAAGPTKSPAPVAATATRASPPAEAVNLDAVAGLEGTMLGAFELSAVLGRGHHGVVYRARSVKDDRPVALKVFHPSFPKGEGEADRFLQAAKTRLALRHPNLVTAFGVGRVAPYTWMSMELVDGDSVAEAAQKFGATGVPEWPEAFRLAVHIARALHFTSAKGLGHRNVTPANVLYRTTDSLYKLNDLLLARALAGSGVRQAVLRQKVAAEMAFFSPEQTQPSPVLDARTDLYCLGAVVYLVLMGRPPFPGRSATELLPQIRNTDPERPRKLQPDIPEIFEAVVLRLLAKKPEDRFQTPAELLAALTDVGPDPL